MFKGTKKAIKQKRVEIDRIPKINFKEIPSTSILNKLQETRPNPRKTGIKTIAEKRIESTAIL